MLSALDAQVALDFGGLIALWTTPNAREILQFPHISGRRIVTRTDGLWGPQEYTRWPQQYHPDVVHHVCIPVEPVTDESSPGSRIWLPLQEFDFERPANVWPRDYGNVSEPAQAQRRLACGVRLFSVDVAVLCLRHRHERCFRQIEFACDQLHLIYRQ